MKIKFTDVDGNELDLTTLSTSYSYYPVPDFGDIDNNIKVLDKYGVEGGYETGDASLNTRKGSVKINFIAKSDLDYRIRFAQITNFFKPSKRPFYIEDIDNHLRTKIAYDGLKWSTKAGEQHRIGTGEIKFIMLDGLWEGDEVTVTSANVSANSSIYFVVSGAIEVYNAYPKIKVTTSGANPDFSITNVTNTDTIRIQQVALTSGQFIQIDSVDGLIRYGTVLSPVSKTGGSFPTLANGLNQILYESTVQATSIEIVYRPRFVI